MEEPLYKLVKQNIIEYQCLNVVKQRSRKQWMHPIHPADWGHLEGSCVFSVPTHGEGHQKWQVNQNHLHLFEKADFSVLWISRAIILVLGISNCIKIVLWWG